jgi:Zn finger protein HypA/HybF involved in hydrogenase expression
MSHSNKNLIKSSITTLNLHNTININNNNKISVTKTFLSCNTCGKSIRKNQILCYIFIDYFCSEKCHLQKHKIHLEKIVNVDSLD